MRFHEKVPRDEHTHCQTSMRPAGGEREGRGVNILNPDPTLSSPASASFIQPSWEPMDQAASRCGPRGGGSWLTAEARVQSNLKEQTGDTQPRSLLEKALPQSLTWVFAVCLSRNIHAPPSPAPARVDCKRLSSQHCYWPSSSWAGHCGSCPDQLTLLGVVRVDH